MKGRSLPTLLAIDFQTASHYRPSRTTTGAHHGVKRSDDTVDNREAAALQHGRVQPGGRSRAHARDAGGGGGGGAGYENPERLAWLDILSALERGAAGVTNGPAKSRDARVR